MGIMAKDNQDGRQARKKAAKRPYLKPAFQRERVFETMALACGKVQSTQGPCHFNRKSS
jgi:hypothetical protein